MKESRESYTVYIKNLYGEYKDTFEKVETYCDILLDYEINTKEEILSFVLDTFLNAQKDNIPVQKIVGNDLVKYCDNVCSGIPFKYRIKRYIKSIESFSCVILVFVLIDIFNAISSNNNILDLKYNISHYAIALIVMHMISIVYNKIEKQIIKNRLAKNKKIKKLARASIWIFTIIIFIITYMVFEILEKYTNITFLIPTWVVLIMSFFGIGLGKIIYRNDAKIEYTNINDILKIYIESSTKRFKKFNQKNSKKGKQPLTEEQFLKKELIWYKYRKSVFSIGFFIIFFFQSFNIMPDYSIEIFFHQSFEFMFKILFIRLIYGFIFKADKQIIEKYQYLLDNNISVDEWK